MRTSLPAALPLIEVDATLIERVLVNLIDNALKYTQAESMIFISAQALGTSLYCCVEDDGPGLPAIDAEELFEAFRRGQKESPISGVGLGLALCRSIVAAHGGTIRAESRTPTGARFNHRPIGQLDLPELPYRVLIATPPRAATCPGRPSGQIA